VRAKFKAGLVGIALIGCSAGVVTWFGDRWWPQHSPQDFEQCSAQIERTSSSKDEHMTLKAQCSKQFVGRRKTGGGYTYYDFLQNRHFDIAGPNPTPNELRYFDEQYTSYLDTQRREAVAAGLAEQQNRMAQPDFQNDRVVSLISPPGSPVVIGPTRLMFQSRGHAAQWFNQMACAKMHRYRATGLNFLLGLRNFSNLTQG
jgi:hypothetical protein